MKDISANLFRHLWIMKTRNLFFGRLNFFLKSDIDGEVENIESDNGNKAMKVLPSWMINQGMNLTAEQRGETKQEAKMADSLPAEGISDDKTPPTDKDDVNIIEDEYLKAYYAALLSRQRDLEADAKREQETSNATISNEVHNNPTERQVGTKSKRCDESEGDDVEWDESPAGSTTSNFKVNDSNVKAEASDKDEDNIDWEEGDPCASQDEEPQGP
ncbi:general transcription factor IIE subunit 1-like [Forsythia ovata]|uniref:General transcription factor IIE subunit 1-like n=1 Tax=Forsythia ovata TaxID=205694 RepID=A0ABD1PG55_9LAMI